MVKNYIKRNNKVYQVDETEVKSENVEFHIAQLEQMKEDLEAEKEAIELLED